MQTNTRAKILEYIATKEAVTIAGLVREFELSPQIIHRHVKTLLEANKIIKIGQAPKVYYQINSNEDRQVQEVETVFNDFAYFRPNGEVLQNVTGFREWCADRNFNFEQYKSKYLEISEKYRQYFDKNGLIDATNKAQTTYKNEFYLDKLFYRSFSAIEIFGRTKWYSYLLYSKQNQDKKLMQKMFEEIAIAKIVENLISKYDFQAVGFVPPSVKRKIQFQTELQKYLNLNLPIIKINKISRDIVVPQKTLAKPSERIENAKATFFVEPNKPFSRILLIDDFVGSGATLNFIAQKISANNFNNPLVIGLALCGTPNGVIDNSSKFEVLSEA